MCGLWPGLLHHLLAGRSEISPSDSGGASRSTERCVSVCYGAGLLHNLLVQQVAASLISDQKQIGSHRTMAANSSGNRGSVRVGAGEEGSVCGC